jgi:hypothetical protein
MSAITINWQGHPLVPWRATLTAAIKALAILSIVGWTLELIRPHLFTVALAIVFVVHWYLVFRISRIIAKGEKLAMPWRDAVVLVGVFVLGPILVNAVYSKGHAGARTRSAAPAPPS